MLRIYIFKSSTLCRGGFIPLKIIILMEMRDEILIIHVCSGMSSKNFNMHPMHHISTVNSIKVAQKGLNNLIYFVLTLD